MEIINTSNIPEVLFNAIKHNWYPGTNEERDWSATELIKPAKSAILSKRHKNEIKKDAETLFWSMLGSAMHIILEKGSVDDKVKYLVEDRNKTIILDTVVSGGLDIYDKEKREVIDFKFQTVWNWIYLESHYQDLKYQLNMYKLLMERHGYKVDKLTVLYVFRDFREWEKERYKTYPDTWWKEVDIEIMSEEEILEYVKGRVKMFTSFNDIKDNDIPVCTEEERWFKQGKAEVYAGTKKYATFDTEEEAQIWLNEKQYKNCRIKVTKSESKRCKYCDGKDFCNFYLSNKPIEEEIELNEEQED